MGKKRDRQNFDEKTYSSMVRSAVFYKERTVRRLKRQVGKPSSLITEP